MQRQPVTAYIALGANLGDACATVLQAMQRLGAVCEAQRVRCSPLYRSAPVDAVGPDFINAVVALDTRLCAPELLQRLHQLEHASGRERPYRNAPRTLDLDLLLYGSARIDSPALTVPHPRMLQRAFVLRPLADLAPELVMPAQWQAVQAQTIHKLPLTLTQSKP